MQCYDSLLLVRCCLIPRNNLIIWLHKTVYVNPNFLVVYKHYCCLCLLHFALKYYLQIRDVPGSAFQFLNRFFVCVPLFEMIFLSVALSCIQIQVANSHTMDYEDLSSGVNLVTSEESIGTKVQHQIASSSVLIRMNGE